MAQLKAVLLDDFCTSIRNLPDTDGDKLPDNNDAEPTHYNVLLEEVYTNVAKLNTGATWCALPMDIDTFYEQYHARYLSPILEVDELRYMFDMDEDMYKAKSSIAETILVSSFLQNNIVEKVEFGNMIEKDGFIQCDFAEIHLKNNQVIFLDPTFHYGIGIGGKEQKEYWTYCNQKSLK